MSDHQEQKPRSIHATDEEWEKIRTAAKKARQSITQFILSAALERASDSQ